MANKLLFLLFLIFPFGQLFKFQLLPAVNLHALDVVCVSLVTYFLLRRGNYKWPVFTRPLISFWVVAAFSLLVNAPKYDTIQILTGAFYLVRFIVYSSLYFVTDRQIKKDKSLRPKIVNGLLVIGASISIFGFIQYLFYPDIRPLKEFGWDPHLYRLFGTFLDPAFTGILFVFYLLLLLSLFFSGSLKKIYTVPQFLLGMIALYLTYSRASYLAFLAGLTAILITKGKTKVLLIFSFLFLISLFLLPRTQGIGTKLERTSTIMARLGNYQETLNIISKDPLFGVGFNLYRYASGKNLETHSGAGADSSLLFIFATIGVMGLLIYLSLWLKILHQAWSGRNSVQGVALFSSGVAVLVHSFFSNTLFYPWVLVWLGILMGLTARR